LSHKSISGKIKYGDDRNDDAHFASKERHLACNDGADDR
jgi:hypothetical protein